MSPLLPLCFTFCFVLLRFTSDALAGHRLHFIDRHVARGNHYVECQLLGEEDDRNVPPFKIIGIFAT